MVLSGFSSFADGRRDQRFSTAGFYAVEGSPRTVANFNPGWRFHKGDASGAEAVGFDDREWEAANLPHGLEILGENASGCRNYQGKAWYRKKFAVNKASSHGKVFIYFEAVMGEAQVWVNGKEVAHHFGGYLPFAADVTDVLNANGKPNVVAVMADNSNSKLYPPGKEQNKLDFTYMGGIYRDTYLIETGPLHVTLRELSDTVAGGGIFAATLDVNGSDAEMEVRTEVAKTVPRSWTFW
ncbi:Beta-galactosidase BoGH2A [Pontiella sulfatireligans]|uniref:Beta-galactosidase BoGH2A n=2 Tax=Pontiella sulfatireligans TaxID=2750658 RepID=A0A6C2UKL9_9BACT|nr:Beta-galactosidase BoGH2A [Pontiella sulfatireligans]